MGSNPIFVWSEKAKSDLFCIVNASDEAKRKNWSDIATKFKKIHANYEGKNDALRRQFQRFYPKPAMSSPVNAEPGNVFNQDDVLKKGVRPNEASIPYFKWTEQAKNDLFCIVSELDESQSRNWSDIATKFKKIHGNYKGKTDALILQYTRLYCKKNMSSSVNENEVKDTFTWSDRTKKDLLSIANAETSEFGLSNVPAKFKEQYPLYDGKDYSVYRQYSRIQSQKRQSVKPFVLTKAETLNFVRLVNLITVDNYPNWAKIWHTFRRDHTNFDGSKEDLRCLYEKIRNDDNLISPSDETSNVIDWNETMDTMLAQATGRAQHIRSAQIRDGRKKCVDNLAKTTVNVFKEIYKAKNGVDFIGLDAIILKHFFEYKESLIPSSLLCEDEFDSVSNYSIKKLHAHASKNHTMVFSKVFKECCHNCGFLFPRPGDPNVRKLLSYAINEFPRVSAMRVYVPYIYYIDEQYITCRECYNAPDWQNDYSIAIYDNTQYGIPSELSNLNEYEQNQIALCGGFYSLYRKQNIQRKIFEHRQGECNIGKKRDMDYHSMFTTFFNIERPHKFDSSNEKIKTALRWLKKNNRLFNNFLSNYETIYGYLMSCHNLRPEERIIQISKGSLADMVGKDTMGLMIPADNVKIESGIQAASHNYGVQHPLSEKLNSLRGIINVNYSDSDLEAKRWPHLFPSGNGSWKRHSSLKQQTYVKHRLLSIDDRFRKTNEFMFFWYDRLIKERLLYYNNRQRTVNVSDLTESIRVKDVRENSNRYGSVVPSTISGSKTYWNARCLDLLALVRELGKPDLFVTLTQNDNWFELQEACGQISAEELKMLDKIIMQPAIGGSSVVKYPVETVVAFYKRLQMFMKSFIHNKTGPFGEVIDYWYRIEYQNRGALHCHMVLWIVEDTIPEDVVTAEMPRYSGNESDVKNQTFQAREYVKAFQIHNCVLGGCKTDIKARCKYGFPYGIQLSEEINESKMGYRYMRHSDEDKNVVPYNMYLLMCWNGHVNVQKVTSNGIEAYLCKYVSKPERSIDIKDLTSDCDKFIKARVVGILECCAHLLQFHQVRSSRKTLFLPCDFQPKHRMLKRKMHLSADEESGDVFYETLLHKYLVRPVELEKLTYVDMFRFYDVVSAKAQTVFTQTHNDSTQDESESELLPKLDENHFELSGRIRKIRSQRVKYVSNGYKYVERGKAAVPRWRFLMPFGIDSEKYYEQRLLLNVPLTDNDLNDEGFPFSDDNVSKTFIEECCLRGLVDSEDTAKSALLGAVQRGFSIDRVLEIAALFVDQSFVTKEYVDSIIVPWIETMPCENDIHDESDNEYGEELAKMLEMRVKYEPYENYLGNMTESQRNVMDWVDVKLKKGDQILAVISGGAGVGKSYITKALYSYFVGKMMVCILLATTGSAAHLIGGTTVHYYLKLDIHGNKYLQQGTISAKVIEDTDVIIVDEFSMLNSDMLDQLNESTKEFGKSKHSPFGGKNIFLIGDPCQLPAINQSVFSNPLLNYFNVLLLKETVRQTDKTFASLLNRVRVDMMTDEDIALLKTRYTPVSDIDIDEETLIVTATRKKMHYYNQMFIKKVPGEQISMHAEDFESDTNKPVSSAVKEKIRKYIKNLWDEELIIKEGCIVRLLRNLDVSTGWVNSKRARVFRVAKDGSYIVLQDINDASKQLPLTKIRQPFKLGANLYYRFQYPLILGYSSTVHSVQGTTVHGKYYVDLDRSFWESGQVFVALSRPKELSQLHLLNTHFEKVYLKPYYKELLKWMCEVDEIALIRKTRCIGDFPLLPLEEQAHEKMQVFPSLAIVEKKATNIKNPPFKAPRKDLSESISELNIGGNVPSLTVKNKNPVASTTVQTCPQINTRIYRTAEAFLNICRSDTLDLNKLRFGTKFMNELLEELNAILNISDVSDPLLYKEHYGDVSHEAVEKWDVQVSSTFNFCCKYICQFRSEFEEFSRLLLSLDVCKYSGQTVADNLQPLFIYDRKWQPVSTTGDGRCFYHSVSLNLIGNLSLSNALKLWLSYVIFNEFEIYDAIFSELASSAFNVLLKVLSYNCWADMEIITAMSYAFTRPIVVISGLDGSQSIADRIYNPLQSELEPIHMAHVKLSRASSKPNHFVALLHDTTYNESTHSLSIRNLNLECQVDDTVSLPDEDVEMLDAYESLTESL